MPNSRVSVAGGLPGIGLVPGMEEFVAWNQGWLQTQALPWQMWLNWQGSLASIQQELWDEWVCHWGGGVPIDR